MIISDYVYEINDIISDAEESVISDYNNGEVETEPSFTDRFIGGVKHAWRSRDLVGQGYKIRVRTLRDRGPNAPENEFGCDFVTIIDVDTDEYKMSKGFLVQAKRSGKGGVNAEVDENIYACLEAGNGKLVDFTINVVNASFRLSSSANSDSKDLYEQCKDMLSISPASYIFVYDSSGIVVVPALSIVGHQEDDTRHPIGAKSLSDFFIDYLMCFVGDSRISAFDDKSLRRQKARYYASQALLIQVRDDVEQYE